jgi:hypothetical protein
MGGIKEALFQIEFHRIFYRHFENPFRIFIKHMAFQFLQCWISTFSQTAVRVRRPNL